MTDAPNEIRQPRRRERRRRSGCGCGRIICLLLTVLTGLYVVALIILQKAFAEEHLPTFLATYLPQPPLLLPPILMALCSLLLRYRRLLLLNVFFIILAITVLIPPNIARRAKAGTEPLRLVTWNLHESYHDIPRMREELGKLKPDIVCLQEARRKSFSDLLPEGQSAHTHEVTTLTTGRIVSSREIRLGPYPNYRWGLETVIDLPQGRVKVLNVHFITAFTGRTLRQNSYDIAGFIEHTRQGRANETAAVLAWLRSPGGNMIVAGDFNTPPNARIHRQLTAEAVDAFSAGWGWGLTYRRERPLVRIDHVFLKDGPLPVRAFAVDGRASDHRMMVADVVIERDGQGDQ